MKEKKVIYVMMGVFFIFILVMGVTTAWFEWKSETNTNVTFDVEGLNITYEGEETVIKGNLYPTMYMDNLDNVIHTFSLVTTSNIEIHSKMSLEIITLPDELTEESFRWNLYKDGTQISSGSFQNASVGTDLLLTPYETITTIKSNYTLYIWIDGEHYDNPLTMGGQIFEFRLKLEASQLDYTTSDQCFVLDESTGTITGYRNGIVESYDIHPECVANAQTNLGMIEEDATTICSGGAVDGMTIEDVISIGQDLRLQSVGIITNVVYSLSCPKEVVIPSSINGTPVTSIGDSAFSEKALTSVVIPDSVTLIGDESFSYNNISSVYIGVNSNLTETTGIGGAAFSSSNNTVSVNDNTYVNNPNLTIYNNSGKKFKWYYVTQLRNDSTLDAYNFITGTVPLYTIDSITYNAVTITTGGKP